MVLIQYITIKQSVYTQDFITVIQKATYFGSMRQPPSGFSFQKYIKKRTLYRCSYAFNSKRVVFTAECLATAIRFPFLCISEA
jgi:hypothetical protein